MSDVQKAIERHVLIRERFRLTKAIKTMRLGYMGQCLRETHEAAERELLSLVRDTRLIAAVFYDQPALADYFIAQVKEDKS